MNENERQELASNIDNSSQTQKTVDDDAIIKPSLDASIPTKKPFKKNVIIAIVSVAVVIIISLIAILGGAGKNNGSLTSVNDLIERGKYEEALEKIEENPDKYVNVYDEVRYKVAEIAFENGEYEKGAALLANNSYEQTPSLLNAINYKLAERALDKGNYETAINLLKENSFENSDALLNYAYDLSVAAEIEKHYNEMLAEIDEYNPDKWTPNFDYMDGSDFYLRINDMLNDTYDILVRDNNLEKAQEQFDEIFGYKAKSISQAKKDIENLKELLGFEESYNSPFCYYFSLHYLMEDILKNTDNVRFELTETSGFAIIEHPHLFLQEKGISSKVFAYLLGTCKNFGGEITCDKERIVITFKNTEYGEYFSRGYYYCAPNSQHDTMFNFYDDLNFDSVEAYITSDGLEVTYEIKNDKQYDIKYLSINVILLDKYDNHIECSSKLLKNVDDKTITFTVLFRDVTLDDLPDSEYGWYYFLAAVMN